MKIKTTKDIRDIKLGSIGTVIIDFTYNYEVCFDGVIEIVNKNNCEEIK